LGEREDLVRLFPVIAHLALCSHSPPECFQMLCSAVGKGEVGVTTNLPEWMHFCRKRDPDWRGLAWEFTDAHGQPFPRHRIYSTVPDVLERSEDGSNLLTMYLLAPERALESGLVRLCPIPKLLNPYDDPGASGFNAWPIVDVSAVLRGEPGDRVTTEKRGLMELYVAALTARMMGTVALPNATLARQKKAGNSGRE
jgi:hypothetical protein